MVPALCMRSELHKSVGSEHASYRIDENQKRIAGSGKAAVFFTFTHTDQINQRKVRFTEILYGPFTFLRLVFFKRILAHKLIVRAAKASFVAKNCNVKTNTKNGHRSKSMARMKLRHLSASGKVIQGGLTHPGHLPQSK